MNKLGTEIRKNDLIKVYLLNTFIIITIESPKKQAILYLDQEVNKKISPSKRIINIYRIYIYK